MIDPVEPNQITTVADAVSSVATNVGGGVADFGIEGIVEFVLDSAMETAGAVIESVLDSL